MMVPPDDEPSFAAGRRRVLAGAAALSAAWLAGCASAPPVTAVAAPPRPIWPRPPDRPRFIHEATLRRPSDIKANAQSTLLTEVAGAAPDAPVFEKPAAVVARHGRIYVTDSVRRHVVVFDVGRRRVFTLGLRPPGRLAKPAGLALDGRANVYVADATARKIFIYDGLGLLLGTVGGPETLERPTGVAVDGAGERIYAIDRATNESEAHRVRVFARDGKLLGEIGKRGHGPGEFNVPVAGAVGHDGTLYVLDAGNFRVQSFSAAGELLHAFGKMGASPGDLARPRGLALDDHGRIYVSDASFGNVQIFEPGGQLLLAIGHSGRQDAPGRFGLPYGVAVDETGRLYVADQLFNKVEVIRPLTEPEGEALLRA